MAIQIVPNVNRDIIISMHYDETGKESVIMFDNTPLSWAVDDVTLAQPTPVIVGALPPKTVDTAPILSPQWGIYSQGHISVPDVVELSATDFFDWLATNNGANRKVTSQLRSADLANAFNAWSKPKPPQ